MTAKKWVNTWVIFLVVIEVAFGFFNFIVDPYKIYDIAVSLDGFNYKKPEVGSYLNLHKNERIRAVNPKSMIIGNSLVEFGFDIEHPIFIEPSYNFGVGGSSIDDHYTRIIKAASAGNLKQVFLVLDVPYSLEVTNNEAQPNKYAVLFHGSTLISSFKTIQRQNYPHVHYLNNGLREQTLESATWENVNIRFNNDKQSKFVGLKDKNNKYDEIFKHYIKRVDDIAKFTQDNQIDLIFVLPRLHKIWINLLDEKTVDLFKQEINEISLKRNILFFDLSNFKIDEKSIDAFNLSDKDASEYFWDAHHFKASFGNMMLDEISNSRQWKEFYDS